MNAEVGHRCDQNPEDGSRWQTLGKALYCGLPMSLMLGGFLYHRTQWGAEECGGCAESAVCTGARCLPAPAERTLGVLLQVHSGLRCEFGGWWRGDYP
jgi:hypothetical protein